MGTEKPGDPIRVHTPLQRLNKSEIIAKGLALGVDYALTNTCYDPNEQKAPCGICDACVLRQRAFLTLGTLDPLPYQTRITASSDL